MGPEVQGRQYVIDVNPSVRSALDPWLASVEIRRKEISPDGRHVVFIADSFKPYLARVRPDGEIQIIELRLTPKPRVQVDTHPGTKGPMLREVSSPEGDEPHAFDFAFSPNGKYLAVSGYRPGNLDRTQNIEVYSLASLKTREASAELMDERSKEFTQQMGTDGEMRNLRQAFLDARVALPVRSRHLSPQGPARLTIALDNNGDLLAGSIAVTRVKDNPKDDEGRPQASIDYWHKAEPVPIEGGKLHANATATTIGPRMMAVGTGYGEIRVFDRDGNLRYDFDLGHLQGFEASNGKRRQPVLDLSFSPDGNRLFVGAKAKGNANFIIYFSKGEPKIEKIEDQPWDISKTVFSSNGIVATADAKGHLVLRDSKGEKLSSFMVPRFADYMARLNSPINKEASDFLKVVPREDNVHLALQDESGVVVAQKKLKAADGVGSSIIDMRFDPEGDAMIVVQVTGMLSYWDVSKPKQPRLRYATRIVNRTEEEANPMSAVHMEALDEALKRAANLSAEEYVELLFTPIERRLAEEAKAKASAGVEVESEPVAYDPREDSSLDSLPDLSFLLEPKKEVFNTHPQRGNIDPIGQNDSVNGVSQSGIPPNAAAQR